MKKLLLAAAAASVFATAADAQVVRVCSLSDISATAVACSGFYAGNLLGANFATAQQTGLAAIGFNWDGNFNTVTKINSLGGATLVNFANADINPFAGKLYGTTYIGLHFGNSAFGVGQSTGFFKISAGLEGIQSFMLNITKGSSGVVLYSTQTAPDPDPVPEPAAWALLLIGFGVIGAASRRRRPPTGNVTA